ncbi:Mitogen-activated protein kinase 8 [Tetrabaena socialis]|uniref:Mitogen-activated protein kinase 8 n=1 Tax=Tetrabaena socialis TaxID=47790 RepID=A0A2J7ZP78_9CHLO|nr:Mitogen-activated protein kinase 8 [Tetrabaena socialis]PNH02075.1 Mitogen-activated protein kinase 8 [Tetrabaena socialis]|eukprot:PNG99723.1 Mitogen-activated protein kinase 8 [Tetrabaena socialis]
MLNALKPLGGGAFGSVYKAIDPVTCEPVAVKVLDPRSTNHKNFAFRLQQEVTMQERCCPHPNVCQIRQVSTTASSSAIIMDFSDTTLRHVRDLVLSEEELRCVMSQLLLGVHHIHSLGIIHRDINPRNILLDHAGTVRIADFGLAGRATPDMWLGDSPDRVVTENYRPPDMLIGASATE